MIGMEGDVAESTGDPGEYMRASLKNTLSQSVTRVKEIFEAWDTDSSGSVSAAEFRQAVRSLGFGNMPRKDIDLVFRELDIDGSGQLSYFELENKIRKIAGVAVNQHYDLRRIAGGRKGAALATTVKIDRSSGNPIPEVCAAHAPRL